VSLPFRLFRGTVFRAHHPRWSFAPDSGDGAALHGGRFNRKGIPALYTALRPETAWLEAQQGFPFKPQPLTLCAYLVDCADILDLSDAATVSAAAIDVADLACAWEGEAMRGRVPPTWQLSDRLIAGGAAGIVVPSFAPGATLRDRNLVFWNWRTEPPHQVRVVDDQGRLPRDDSSWR
jgi:RES domain-containing protein